MAALIYCMLVTLIYLIQWTQGLQVIRDKFIDEEMEEAGLREACNNDDTRSPCSCKEVIVGEIIFLLFFSKLKFMSYESYGPLAD